MTYNDLWFMINTLVPEGNEKQNPDQSCTRKYQKHVLVVMATN